MKDSLTKKQNDTTPSYRRLLNEANKLIFIKRYAEAKQVLSELLAREPNNVLVHLRYIELAIKMQEIKLVANDYQRQDDSMLKELCLALLAQLTEQHSPTTSIACYQGIVEKYCNSACACYGIGYDLERLGEYERAISYYEKSLALDPDWYPSYLGLSQIYYQKKSYQKGDHYFYLFEQIAPYNIYGNFDTHRQLSREFFQQGRYCEAHEAITALVQWWQETRRCPTEIILYEQLHRVKIEEAQGNQEIAKEVRAKAMVQLDTLLHSKKTDYETLLLLVSICREFSLHRQLYITYQKCLLHRPDDKQFYREINNYYLGRKNLATATKLFREVYATDPENGTCRFWLLVSRLQGKKVDVESYLRDKEKMQQMVNIGSDKLDLLNLLHSMLTRFAGDADVYEQLATFYREMDAGDKAKFYMDKMYRTDRRNSRIILVYAAFLLTDGELDKGHKLLSKIVLDKIPSNNRGQYLTLRARYCAEQNNFTQANSLIKKAGHLSPWQLTTLVAEIYYLSQVYYQQKKLKVIDNSIIELNEKGTFEGKDFYQLTVHLVASKLFYLAYLQAKLLFLYQNNRQSLRFLLDVACHFNPDHAIYDFIKLLNTNYDNVFVVFALGILCKERWQHESATMWFSIALQRANLDDELKKEIYLELADCYVWQDKELMTAIDYAQSANIAPFTKRAMQVLGHAYLKKGKVKLAQTCLQPSLQQLDAEDNDYEIRYLVGLLEYQRGYSRNACKIWQPILHCKVDNVRLHHIKQEVLKYYSEDQQHFQAS